ncbi:MAG TPA: metallophosphoesterase [Bacillus sp. (in: firmicutes)]|uniref:metallophosphoesterase n=1 Tax=Bacillus litorisediminis TaxID=2922713 RepID=UPI001FAE3D8F|nr:metallophosphoesterase [Bacillus litorisediminis]HWO75210.1 metallophosphoesterase [Bacillus sp. (in: firmicutes)]
MFGWILTISLVGLLTVVFYKGYKNTKNIAVNYISIDSSKKSSSSRPFRILHLSDLHLENISITPKELYETLKDEPIDLIAITGDFLDRKRTIPKLKPYLQVLNQLAPQYGTYAVFGNHDYVLRNKNFQELKKVLEENNCKTMQNENDTIMIDGSKLHIIGIDDYSTKRSQIEKSYENIENGYNLVLTHDPNVVLGMKDYHYDYLLSGHFHGGQIHWPKPYHLVKMGKLVRMNMVKGLHQHDGKIFYISEGLGQTALNIRLGSRPEITIHNIMLPIEADESAGEAV